jgi:hypothetical protein
VDELFHGCARLWTHSDNLVSRQQKKVILLEKNGKMSSISKRTKHVNRIRYYFIKDRIANKELSVVSIVLPDRGYASGYLHETVAR